MDVIVAIRMYIDKMIDEAGPGMKVILMDKETTPIVSMVFAQSEMLQKEVFLFERLEGLNRQSIRHLKCVCFVRPSKQNVQLLTAELKQPKYASYYIYFSNVISKQDIKSLAEGDDQEVVREVQEFYGDYIPVSSHMATLNLFNSSQNKYWAPHHLPRSVQGLTSLLLSLKKSPLIRFQNSSEMARRMADMVKQVITREASLFDFRRVDIPPLLLIIHRSDDPFTPLLNQWTYQAMVHELIGITNNRTTISSPPPPPPSSSSSSASSSLKTDSQELVLSEGHDPFFRKNMYLNFGEIGASIKLLVDDYQVRSKKQAKVESISDMKAFIETYPSFKKMSGTVAKHVSLVSELSKIVSECELMAVSECEQEIVCLNDHNNSIQKIHCLMTNPNVRLEDLLRLVMLYALAYEGHANNNTGGLLTALKKRRMPDDMIKMVGLVREYGGERVRTRGIVDAATPATITRKLFRGLKEVENIYTQHKPVLIDILDQVVKGRLREGAYPYLGQCSLKDRPQDIVVFQIGGTTYEESAAVHHFNNINNNVRVVLVGTCVHNFKSFLQEVRMATEPCQ